MRDHGINVLGPGGAQDFGRTGQRSRCLGEIVDEKDILPLNIANDVLRFGFGRADAAFDHDGQTCTEHLRVSRGHFDAAHVGRHHDKIGNVFLMQILDQDRQGVEMVDGYVEKPLQLLRMQVHGEQTVHPRGHEKVGYELGGDRHTRLVFAVLARVAEKRNHGRDPRGTGAAGCVDQDEQFHQVLVRRRTRRLDNEDVAAAHVLVDPHERLAVRKRAHCGIAQGNADVIRDGFGQLRVRCSREEPHFCFAVIHKPRGSPNGGWSCNCKKGKRGELSASHACAARPAARSRGNSRPARPAAQPGRGGICPRLGAGG